MLPKDGAESFVNVTGASVRKRLRMQRDIPYKELAGRWPVFLIPSGGVLWIEQWTTDAFLCAKGVELLKHRDNRRVARCSVQHAHDTQSEHVEGSADAFAVI